MMTVIVIEAAIKPWFNIIQLFTFQQVDVDIVIESNKSFPITEEMRIKAHSLRFHDLAHYFHRS